MRLHRDFHMTLCFLLACLVVTFPVFAQDKKDDSETVIATYRVKEGKEAEFQKVLEKAWPAYRKLGMALERPHLILRGVDEAKKTYFIEILTWKSHDAPDQASPEVRALWNQLEALCESRLGHRGIEFPEVEIVRQEK